MDASFMAPLFETLPVAMLTIVLVVKVYYAVFAALAVVGGIIGFARAKSVISLVAGIISGAVLATASWMIPGRHPNVAYIMALLVSVLLAGKFVPDTMHKRAVVPGGLMALLSLAGIVLTLCAWYGK
jgi:uncharacterized membrane protein (UPF0136 family)